jgi:hypothetical protein
LLGERAVVTRLQQHWNDTVCLRRLTLWLDNPSTGSAAAWHSACQQATTPACLVVQATVRDATCFPSTHCVMTDHILPRFAHRFQCSCGPGSIRPGGWLHLPRWTNSAAGAAHNPEPAAAGIREPPPAVHPGGVRSTAADHLKQFWDLQPGKEVHAATDVSCPRQLETLLISLSSQTA